MQKPSGGDSSGGEELMFTGTEAGAREEGGGAVETDAEWADTSKEVVGGEAPWRVLMLDEARRIISMAWPLSLSYLMNMSYSLISIIFVGHLGPVELGAAALGSMFCNVTGFSLIIGMMSGFDTLASQAYGANQKQRVGLLFQRSTLICTIQSLLVSVLWLASPLVLDILGQDDDVIHFAGAYIRMMILALPGYIIFEGLRRYLQTLSITLPIMLFSFVSFLVMLVSCYVLVSVLGLGFYGSPIAFVITFNSLMIQALLYVSLTGVLKDTWVRPSMDVLRGWGEYLRVGIPGLIMTCLEWWGFEIQAVIAGIMGVVQLDTHTLLFNTIALFFMLPLAISIGTATRVGINLGAGKPKAARVAGFTALGIVALTQGVLALGLLVFRNYWGYVFSSDEEVVEATARILPLVCSFMLFDGLSGGVCAGILRGTGQQAFGAVTNFIVYYFFGIPLGIVLAFALDMEVLGLWTGLALSTVCCFIVYMTLLLVNNWSRLSDRARERAMHDAPHTFPDDDDSSLNVFRLADTDEDDMDLQIGAFEIGDEEL